jgi:tetratricopeptide (TPR) repeat protein
MSQPLPLSTMRLNRIDALICIGVALLTLGVYTRVAQNGFIGYDDPDYVTANSYVQQGLTRESIKWAFTTSAAANWHPLTWLSHMLDVQLFGMRPAAHHMMSAALHTVSTILLYIVLLRMTGARGAVAFVACVFAIHPLRVESIAWASERKDVLAALFWMITLLAYAYYAMKPGFVRYMLVFVALAIGLTAKPMLVSLPIVLLLLDYWPLRRQRAFGRLFEEKIPLLGLSLASCIVTYWAQQRGGAVVKIQNFPLPARIANAAVAYVRYLGKLFWPTKLTVFYPRPQTIPAWEVAASLALLALITLVALLLARKRPYVIFGWLWYLITLVPVIGIVQVGQQAIADRYTYLPLIGPTIAIAFLARDVVLKGKNLKPILTAAAAACVFAMSILTWRQIGFWKDTYTLFAHALDVTDRNHIAHGYVGTELGKQGKSNDAIQHFLTALEIDPNYAEAHFNLANHLFRQARSEESKGDHRSAGQLKTEALEHYQLAVQLKPDLAEAHCMLGLLWLDQGRTDLATESFRTALELKPGYITARQGLDRAMMLQSLRQRMLQSATPPTSAPAR